MGQLHIQMTNIMEKAEMLCLGSIVVAKAQTHYPRHSVPMFRVECDATSVTRSGELLHFGQLIKACGNNYFAQITHIFRQFLKVSKSFIFLME